MKEYFRVNVRKYCPDKDFDVVRPASLNKPKSQAVMFIDQNHTHLADAFEGIHSCLIFWPEGNSIPKAITDKHAVVICDNPHNEYCRFFRDNHITYLPQPETIKIINGAYIADSAVIGKGVTIMPGAYIGGEVTIGDDAYVGCGVKLVGEVFIGNCVVIRENTVIGADGLTTDRESDGCAITMPQFGSVVLEDRVQIGSNVVIARGAIDETRICRGAKIDSCCFISHNVMVGDDSFVVGEAIMFGSSSVGKQCLISGNATIMNTVHIGDRSVVGAGSLVTKSVADDIVVLGSPAKPKGER